MHALFYARLWYVEVDAAALQVSLRPCTRPSERLWLMPMFVLMFVFVRAHGQELV